MSENVEIIAKAPQIDKKLQVAAYARVSSDSFMMLNSISQQILAYSSLIKSHRDWIYRGVYKDYAKRVIILKYEELMY